MTNKTTRKILVLESSDSSGFDIKFETSKQGIQAWFVKGYFHGVAGLDWKNVEQALAHAIKNGDYMPEILKP